MKTIRTKIRSASFVFYGIFLLCLTTAIALPAQTFTTLHNFHGPVDGANPYAGLVQATNGKAYGTTFEGGTNGVWGTVFQIAPSGKVKTIYSFSRTDGSNPTAAPIQATDGNLYGTTLENGANGNYGTVFQITPSGKLKTIHNFAGTDGSGPTADLMQATDGNLYGITLHGGANGDYGTVFQITPSGKLATLHHFNGTDGSQPAERLVQATADGNLYGTTSAGGDYGLGTVFQITLSGELTTLYHFDGTHGANPYAGLTQSTDGNLYGTTQNGGANNNGTVFQFTLSGELRTIYTFCSHPNCTDGANPYADLIQATNGKLYGTTLRGGDNLFGTVFQITLSGKLTTLHSFDNHTDGANPYGDLIQINGKLYGTTYAGGLYGGGTVFSLSK